MAKVMIYEDSQENLINRYSDLNERNDVSVCIVDHQMTKYLEIFKKKFENEGFNPNNIQGVSNVHEIEKIPEADVYFTDGLKGDCFYLLDRLPKDKTYLLTDDGLIEKKAIEKGYPLASGNLEEIIKNTLNK